MNIANLQVKQKWQVACGERERDTETDGFI